MRRALSGLVFLSCFSSSLFASYAYYANDNLQSYNNSAPNWYINGTSSNSSPGLTVASAAGASYITRVAPSDGSNQYEVAMTLTLPSSGGTYVMYLEATANSLLGSTTTGSFYAFAIQNPVFANNGCSATATLYKVVGGSVSQISSTTVPCGPSITYHAVLGNDSAFHFWVNGLEYMTWTDSQTRLSGAGGIGGYGMPSGNAISLAQIGPCDRIAPGTVDSTSAQTYALSSDVDLQTAGVADDANGSGVMGYRWFRDGAYLTTTLTPELDDTGAAAGSTHSYTVQAQDHHGNIAPAIMLSVPVPQNASIDPRQVGVRPTGSYWGGGGEQIDTRSGNLNFATSLLQAQGRGWTVPVGIAYNSQNWRLDTAGRPWKLGEDVGYGFGWKLQVGSLTPFFSSYFNIAYYQFSDASGASYRLNQNSNGIWTSKESVYVTYDANTQLLHFNNGSFWVLGCTSAGTEQDAGTMYPTLIEDSNGNQIFVQYTAGNSVSWVNSSARIASITDVRGGSSPSSPTYQFGYNNDSVPHLISINNTISTQENFFLAYTGSTALANPFGAQNQLSFGNTVFLSSLNNQPNSLTTSFTYDAGGSGELTQVTLPFGGHLRWQYQTAAYTQSSVREVANRYLQWDSTIGERTYAFSSVSSGNMPQSRQVVDQKAAAVKTWQFNQTAGSTFGLVTSYAEGSTGANSNTLRQTNYAWTQDPVGNSYIGRLQAVSDPGTSWQVTKQTDQVVDQYGNVTQSKLYDYSDLVNPAKTYNTAYVTTANGSDYTALYLRNLVSTASVTDKNNNTVNLQQDTYDQYSTGIAATPNIYEQDSGSYGTSYLTRGNLTGQTGLGTSSNSQYDQTGTAIWTGQTTNPNHYVSYSNGSATNYAAPSLMTTGNSLHTAMTWNAALSLTSQTGANADQTATSYDGAGRPQTVTSPFGSNMNYDYHYNASPSYVRSTINNKAVTTYLDGLGRAYQAQTGDNQGGLQSVVDTVYDSCGCTPMGKPQKVSLPHAPGATPVWKTNSYDALGRTLSVVAPDGASTTTYSYAGNNVTITDQAGKWKQYLSDSFGRLTQVTEQSPGSEPNYVTLYSYDVLDHLVQVRMDRTIGGQVKTQYRTWTYDPGTQLLMSQTAPESGTTSFTYNADSTLATVTDAKSQQKVYNYDTYGKVIQISRGTLVNGQFTENSAQRTSFTYDGANGGFSSNTAGRVSLVNYSGPHGLQFAEMYSYHDTGAVTAKRLSVSGTAVGTNPANFDATYAYDNLGNVSTVQYPFTQWSNGAATASGPQYSYSYDNLFRPNHMSGNNQTLVSNVVYGYAGEMLQMNAGAFTETRTYNASLQLTELVSGANVHLKYNYSATQNNGRISTMQDVVSGETLSYQYDNLNRLVNAAGVGDAQGAWSQAFSYDGFGNLTQKAGSNAPSNMFLTADPLTNRLTGNGVGYDNNGNLSANGTGSFAVSYSYDNENRMSIANPGGTAQTMFSYDPSNQRIYQGTYNTSASTYSNEQIYFYGVDGKKLAAYSLQVSGSNVALASTQTNVWFAGRILTPQDQLQSQGKYFPYGEDRNAPAPANPSNNQEKFATYTRDSSTGLDYAYQRYYNGQVGRFHTMDPLSASALQDDPQTWNRFSYVANNPVNNFDPTGLFLSNGYNPNWVGLDFTQFITWFSFFSSVNSPPVASSSLNNPPVAPSSVDCSKPPPTPPATPPGANLNANVARAAQMSQASWLNQVRPGGGWDYAHFNGQQYAAFGNFSYGATCATFFSLSTCQRGAGAAAYGTASWNVLVRGGRWTAGPGNPFSPARVNGQPDYGDQARASENPSVIAGYQYTAWHKACH